MRVLINSKKDEVTGDWRRLRDEELQDLCPSLNIIPLIKQRIVRCVTHVACIWEKKGAWRLLVGKHEGKNHLEDLG